MDRTYIMSSKLSQMNCVLICSLFFLFFSFYVDCKGSSKWLTTWNVMGMLASLCFNLLGTAANTMKSKSLWQIKIRSILNMNRRGMDIHMVIAFILLSKVSIEMWCFCRLILQKIVQKSEEELLILWLFWLDWIYCWCKLDEFCLGKWTVLL